MVSAITSSPTFAATVGVRAAPGALDGQLAKYQIELADWTNCPSCTTPEGKAKIAEISDKIKEIQQQISASDSARPQAINLNAGNTNTTSIQTLSTPIAAKGATGLIGNNVDTYV